MTGLGCKMKLAKIVIILIFVVLVKNHFYAYPHSCCNIKRIVVKEQLNLHKHNINECCSSKMNIVFKYSNCLKGNEQTTIHPRYQNLKPSVQKYYPIVLPYKFIIQNNKKTIIVFFHKEKSILKQISTVSLKC